MTTVADHQLTAPGDTGARANTPLDSTEPADMGLLLTLNSRMHCRAPMQRVDPEDMPVRLPVQSAGQLSGQSTNCSYPSCFRK